MYVFDIFPSVQGLQESLKNLSQTLIPWQPIRLNDQTCSVAELVKMVDEIANNGSCRKKCKVIWLNGSNELLKTGHCFGLHNIYFKMFSTRSFWSRNWRAISARRLDGSRQGVPGQNGRALPETVRRSERERSRGQDEPVVCQADWELQRHDKHQGTSGTRWVIIFNQHHHQIFV